jgi:predicted Zn-dependent protease
MNIGILRIGKVDADVTDRVRENLNTAFLKAKCSFLPEEMSLPEEAFSKKRQQYRSEVVLNAIATHSAGKNLLDRILGVVDADLFVPRLNFVF